MSQNMPSKLTILHNRAAKLTFAGKMWPAEAFNLVHKAQNFVNLACFFLKNLFCMRKNIKTMTLKQTTKFFGSAMGLELCIPAL